MPTSLSSSTAAWSRAAHVDAQSGRCGGARDRVGRVRVRHVQLGGAGYGRTHRGVRCDGGGVPALRRGNREDLGGVPATQLPVVRDLRPRQRRVDAHRRRQAGHLALHQLGSVHPGGPGGQAHVQDRVGQGHAGRCGAHDSVGAGSAHTTGDERQGSVRNANVPVWKLIVTDRSQTRWYTCRSCST
eukprot:ctg_177.g88